MTDQPRIILAVAAEANDQFIWQSVRTIQTEMFAAGPVQIKFAYFGAEGNLPSRPYVSTRWVTDADDMADLMDHGRKNCVCGCFLQTGDILKHALEETKQGPVQAVIIIGDRFHGDLNEAVDIAKQLSAAGTRVFSFQQGNCDHPATAFERLAEATGGAHFQFNPYIEQVTERLPEMLEAITHFAIGGMAALEAQEEDNESAGLLLEQITDHQLLKPRCKPIKKLDE